MPLFASPERIQLGATIASKDALANIGYDIADSTVANVLKAHGIEPVPDRQRTPAWSTFLKAHWDSIFATDFTTVKVWTQVEKITRWSQQLANGKVTLLFDCEPTGDDGAKEALWQLMQRGLNVRLGWSHDMHGGAFKGRQPESVSISELSHMIGMNRAIAVL